MKDEDTREIFHKLEGDWRNFWIAACLAVVGVMIMCIFMTAIVVVGVWLQ